MAMPRYLIVLGSLALLIVAMGLIGVIGDSWVWSAATESPSCVGLPSPRSCRNGPIAQRQAAALTWSARPYR